MSYILDALRKSDQQRQRGAAPTLPAAPAPAAAPRQPAFLAYGLLAAVLVGAGMAIGWLRPWQPEQAAPGRPEPVAAKPLESNPRLAAPAPSAMAPRPTPEAQVRNVAPPAQAAPAPSAMAPALVPAKPPPAPAKPEPRSAPAEADTTAPRKTAAPASKQPVGTAAADAARVPSVISMAELPLSLQQELPPMTISVHAYSGNPPDRLVGINNRMLREGEDVAPGLKLEQITPDGMIFGYKGYSFRRGVK
jgi:general secretion pathway protein B